MKYLIPALSLLAFAACSPAQSVEKFDMTSDPQVASETLSAAQQPYVSTRTDGLSEMIVAGGCFWCVESDFEVMDGVTEVISGYTGGFTHNPKYKQVGSETTGHYEAAKIIFDPSVVSYETLIDRYWKTVDPTDAGGQFCDRGNSYRTAIFATPEQMAAARASLSKIKETKPFNAEIVTPVLAATTFYDAEDYHQDYYKVEPRRYKFYRKGCGRDKTLEKLWG